MFDNGQPPEWVGQIAAFIFVVWLFLTCWYGWTHPNKRFVGNKADLDFSDDIFYMDDGLQMIPALDEVPSKPKSKPKPLYDKELAQECSDALHQLGYKKSDANKAVKNFLSSNDVQTVEVFLSVFFKKAS